MTHVRTALVIGGGIAGPAAAMALQMAGIEPVIYEARRSGADGTGVFLTLASNGVDALRTLHVESDALTAGFATPEIVLRSATGKYLGSTRAGMPLPDGATSQTLKRADLYRIMHEEALNRGVRIEHDKRLVSAVCSTNGVCATFQDGSHAFGDVLIGCDGVHSTVRPVVDPNAPTPTYLGLLTTGGYASDVEVDSAVGNYEMIFGKRAFFGYALGPSREVWWFANVPRRAEPARGELNAVSGEQWRSRLLELYSEDAGPAVSLIAATPELSPMTAIHAVPHLPVWHRDRMIVIGDAAHAPSPTSGQGASLSLEDAVMLAKFLRDQPSVEAAFASFEAERRPRVERIIKWAARVSSSKVAGPVGRVIRDAMMPTIMRMTADSKAVRQTFDYHIEWDARTCSAA